MPLATPVIVQSNSLSVTSPSLAGNVTLPNPVTVGNMIIAILTTGNGSVSFPGFSLLQSSTGGANSCVISLYQQIAETPVPPVINVPWGGFSSSAVTLMEIANPGEIITAGNYASTNQELATLPQIGSVEQVAGFYYGYLVSVNPDMTYSSPLPAGASYRDAMSGVSVFEGAAYTGQGITIASNNPVTFEFTQGAQFSGASGALFVTFFVTAGNQTVGPVVPPENLAQPSGTQDVVYAVVERIAVRAGVPYRYYTVEVMASRLLGGNLAQGVPNDIEYSWAVDAGVQVAPSSPSANLWITPGNMGAISGIDIVVGGDDFPAEVVATIIDLEGSGSGAAVTFTVTNGVITAYDLTAPGAAYVQPEIQLAPSTGDGAVLTASVGNTCTIYADAAIWTAGNVGQIIRAAGGKVQIASITDPQHVVCTVLEPFTQFIPNTAQPASCLSGEWTQGPMITQLPYLDHLEGQQVVGLADGAVFGPLTVTNGAIALPNAASIVTAGLGFTAQLKTLRLDLGNQGGGTVQTKRKKVSAVTLRVQDTQGLTVGSTWGTMTPIKAAGFAPSNAAVPFSEGGGNQKFAVNGLYGQEPVRYLDQRIITGGGWDPDGQICIQQSNPLPMSLLAIIPEISVGDS